MAVYYTSLTAAILLGVGGQIALKSAADGAASLVAQILNPMTIIGLHNLHPRRCLLYHSPEKDPCLNRLPFRLGELRYRGGFSASALARAPRLVPDRWALSDRQRRGSH